MKVWGCALEMTEEDVLTVVHENMFHNDSVVLRFAINTDSHDDIIVCVKPSRRVGGPSNTKNKSSGQPSPLNYCSKLHGRVQDMLDIKLEEVIRNEHQAHQVCAQPSKKSLPANPLPLTHVQG